MHVPRPAPDPATPVGRVAMYTPRLQSWHWANLAGVSASGSDRSVGPGSPGSASHRDILTGRGPWLSPRLWLKPCRAQQDRLQNTWRPCELPRSCWSANCPERTCRGPRGLRRRASQGRSGESSPDSAWPQRPRDGLLLTSLPSWWRAGAKRRPDLLTPQRAEAQ